MAVERRRTVKEGDIKTSQKVLPVYVIFILRSSLLPDNVKEAETRLGQSMETYRQRCDNLGNSLHGLLNKLEDERYFGDLATEVNKLRKLLSDEKKKVGGERHKLGEVHAMFETIYDEYSRTVDSLDAAQREIQHKVRIVCCIEYWLKSPSNPFLKSSFLKTDA